MLVPYAYSYSCADNALIVSDEIDAGGSNAVTTLTWQMHVSADQQPVVTAGGVATLTGGSPPVTVHLAVANTTLPNGTDTCPGAVLAVQHPQAAPPQYSLQGWAKLVVTAPVRSFVVYACARE